MVTIPKRLTSKKNRSSLSLLLKSIYRYQHSPYIMLRFPKWFPRDTQDEHQVLAGKLVPADYRFAPLIKQLWRYKFVTAGWDSSSIAYKDVSKAFIMIIEKPGVKKKLISFLGKDHKSILSQFSYKTFVLHFHYNDLRKIYRLFKVNVPIPTLRDARPGGEILQKWLSMSHKKYQEWLEQVTPHKM